MKIHNRTKLLLLFLLLTSLTKAQDSGGLLSKIQLGISSGAGAYTGSLRQEEYKGGIGFSAQYGITDNIHVRANVWITELSASDYDIPNFGDDLRSQHYYFRSNYNEFSLLAQYEFFSLNTQQNITPYVFAGIGTYTYKPYQEVRVLRSDGSERNYNLAIQQLSSFNNQQVNFPIGVGLKYAMSNNVRLFAEGNYRLMQNSLLDNYNLDDKNDGYYSIQLGISFKLNGGNSYKKYRYRKSCNCPVY